jgi:glycosyltransferase involved in cell wall biosynthesis
LSRHSILFVTSTFCVGGAERQLLELATGLRRSGWAVTVIACYGLGEMSMEFERAGVQVACVHKRGRWDVFGFIWRLWKEIVRVQPDLVHGYAMTQNLALVVLRPVIGRARVVWGLRNSWRRCDHRDPVTRAQYMLAAVLSRFADLIICNSEAGRAVHVAEGYVPQRMIVVPNGIDVARYRPDPEAGRTVRAGWGIADGHRLVGHIARVDPDKDHSTFLRAASVVAARMPDVRFVCVGTGPESYRTTMVGLGRRLGLEGKLIWAGLRRDMPQVYNALDLAVSSSVTEGFANAIGEAMATGVCCVATDVGDSAAVISGRGAICPAGDSDQLARAMMSALTAAPAAGLRIRQRICDHFSAPMLVARTEKHLLRALRARSGARSSDTTGAERDAAAASDVLDPLSDIGARGGRT